MTNKLTLTEQEELFAKDCKLINLKYEYDGYTGTEKWAIITELTEEELWDKYPDIIGRYIPFVLLSVAQGKVIIDDNRETHRCEMRDARHLKMIYLSNSIMKHSWILLTHLNLEKQKKLQRGKNYSACVKLRKLKWCFQ